MPKTQDYFAPEDGPEEPKKQRHGWGAPAAQFPPDVSLEELARVLDLSGRMVTMLARDGVLPRASYGRYQFLECVQGYIRQLRAQARDQGDDTLSKQRARLTRSRADMAELERLRITGQVAPIAELHAAGVAAAGVVRSRLQAVPTKLANQLLNIKLPRDVETIIREEIDAALEELATLEVAPAENPKPGSGRMRPRNSRRAAAAA